MCHEDLVKCLDEAFGQLERPAPEEMAAPDTYVDEPFLYAVESKTWQDLRPLREYIGDGSDIALLSTKAYQYYFPAYLYALIDEAGDEFYLNGVLDSLWYEDWRDSEERAAGLFLVPRGGWEELMPEVAKQMPHLTYQERKIVAERRVSIAEKLAKLTEMTGRDWADISYLRERWEERMPMLTDQQKECVAKTLVHVLERTSDESNASRIQAMLDKYWLGFLAQ